MYQHSESFAALKNIQEEVKENFTSYQWLSVLDFFLEQALDKIDVCYPLLVNNFIAKSIAWQRNPESAFAIPFPVIRIITKIITEKLVIFIPVVFTDIGGL